MNINIDQLRTSASLKNLLTRIKGITSIQNWNVLCRWGFCFSIKQSTLPRMVDEKLDGVEIDYDVLVGKNKNDQGIDSPLLQDKATDDKSPVAYVCQNYTCQYPARDTATFTEQLKNH